MKFKICIFELIAKIEFKKQSLNQVRHCLTRHIQIWHHFFDKKTPLSVSLIFKLESSQFYDLSEIKQWKWNKIRHFSLGHHSLTSFFIGHKILKSFNNFYNYHISVLLQKWAQTNKIKENKAGYMQMEQHLSLFTKYYCIWMTFEIYLLISFISKMNDNKSRGKMSII